MYDFYTSVLPYFQYFHIDLLKTISFHSLVQGVELSLTGIDCIF